MTTDAHIISRDGEWVVEYHNYRAWTVTDTVLCDSARCADGEAIVSRDEALAIRSALATNGLVVVCDAALVYGGAK